MGLPRAWLRVIGAHLRLLVCRWFGHRWDDSKPAPEGMRYCSRCKQRHHQ